MPKRLIQDYLKQPTLKWIASLCFMSCLLHLFYMQNASLLVEEAYYWNYAQHFDWGYLDHPPMVAVLIKFFTAIGGSNELSVRIGSLLCWFIAAFFSFKLSELFTKGSGIYSLLLLTILPYFFTQSIVITPDSPLIACWSATLYYLYHSLVLGKPRSWYKAGLWLGLGMLSKYTICLLALATFVYMMTRPEGRRWFLRKEPYVAAVIAVFVFSPVIYWNAQHEWVSFLFQSQRRFANVTSFNLPRVFALTLLFLTPVGCWSLLQLGLKKPTTLSSKRFLQTFTFVPWCFFAIHSLNHEINFNWLGPLFLAALPWISTVILEKESIWKAWRMSAIILLALYGTIFLLISLNPSEWVQQKLFIKVIAWDKLIKELNLVAQNVEGSARNKPVFLPLDNYPINSEIAFYQKQLQSQGLIKKSYSSSGAHLFNRDSLMYRFWTKNEPTLDRPLILISKEKWRFDDPEVTSRTEDISALSSVWSQGQGMGLKNIPYYYKVVKLK